MGRAHSGYVLRSNMATPHVFMAREIESTPRMFMTKPVFTCRGTHTHTVGVRCVFVIQLF